MKQLFVVFVVNPDDGNIAVALSALQLNLNVERISFQLAKEAEASKKESKDDTNEYRRRSLEGSLQQRNPSGLEVLFCLLTGRPDLPAHSGVPLLCVLGGHGFE